jgi:ABC-2 type transport system ATP-binding protein
MDEPTVGLDPIHRGHLWQSFRAMADEGAAILITTHVMDEAMQCDKVAMMREGQIIAFDSPTAIIESTGCDNLEEAFVELARDEDRSGGGGGKGGDRSDRGGGGGEGKTVHDA